MRQLHASSERLTGAGQSFALSGLRRWAGSSGGIRRSAGILVRRAPHNLLASTGRLRIFVSAVVRHSNIGQCAEKGLLSVALCHSTLRSCMEVGDVALLISCSRQTPKVEPHVYKEALDGNRRLVSVFRVTERLSPAEYHTQFGERTDSWYRKSRKGDTVRWLADGTELSER